MYASPIVKVVSRGRPARGFTGFGKTAAYVERFTAAIALRQSATLDPARDAVEQMDELYNSSLDADGRNAAYHYVLSWPEKRLEQKVVWDTVDATLRQLRLDHHQWLAAIHGDTEHTHAHVLVSRIDPQTRRFWNTGGRERRELIEAAGWALQQKLDLQLKRSARDFEVHSGQKSFHRWLLETVSPAIRSHMEAEGPSWLLLREFVGREFGLSLERKRDAIMVVDEAPTPRRRQPLELHVAALRLDVDLEAVERTAAEAERAPVAIAHDKGYITAYEAYAIPTDVSRHRSIAPLFERYIADRKEYASEGVGEIARAREMIRSARDQELRNVRREFDAQVRRLRASLAPDSRRDFDRLIVPMILKPLYQSDVADIRLHAKRELEVVSGRVPPPTFREWLKVRASEGDLAAHNALVCIRSGVVAEQLRLDYAQSVEAAVDINDRNGIIDPAPERTPGEAGASRTASPEELLAQETTLELERDGIRGSRGQKAKHPRSGPAATFEDAVRQFGNTDLAGDLMLRYRQYVGSYLAGDVTQVQRAHAKRLAEREQILRDAAIAEKREMSQLPSPDLRAATAIARARDLRNHAAFEQARDAERRLVKSVLDREPMLGVHQYLRETVNTQDAHTLADLMPANVTFEPPSVQPKTERRRDYLLGLTWERKGADVLFSVGNSKAFVDAEEMILAQRGSTIDGDRAALEYAVVRFGPEVELTGSKAYKLRMLKLAVEMGIIVTNTDLAEERQKLIAKQELRAEKATGQSVDAKPTAEERRLANELRVALLKHATSDEREQNVRAIVADALSNELETKHGLDIERADGAIGELKNVFVFNNVAFALVREQRETKLISIPTDIALAGSQHIGDRVDYSIETIRALAEEKRITQERLLREAEERARAAQAQAQQPAGRAGRTQRDERDNNHDDGRSLER